MIPNAWFYKLKDMSRKKASTTSTHPINQNSHNNPSYSYSYSHSHTYYLTKDTCNNIVQPPQPLRSNPPSKTKATTRRRTIYRPSPSPVFLDPVCIQSPHPDSFLLLSSESDDDLFASPHQDQPLGLELELELGSRSTSSSDIIIDIDMAKFNATTPELELPPPSKLREIKPRPSPNISVKETASNRNRNGISTSFAVVKSSVDPQRDFRESMVEMILENNIRASKDFEHLLACYLSLNSKECHNLIIKAFEQTWYDMITNQISNFPK